MKTKKQSNKKNKLHLEIQKHRVNPYGLLRSSARENGKVIHQTHARLVGLELGTLLLIQAALQGNVVKKSDFKIEISREYGASLAVYQLAKNLGLDKAIYSRTNEPWVKDCLAMIIGKLVYAGSKLSLTNINKDSALWEICGIHDPDIDVNIHCYAAMDKLKERQEAIQKYLAKKHLEDGTLILYDITSSYLEGEYEKSELVAFGYNRDMKKGHEQIVIGLMCGKDGCPISVEVFKGNTKDEQTVLDKVADLKKKYNLKTFVFVGDRGMLTKLNLEEIQKDEYIKTISALTHPQIKELCHDGRVQFSLFDEKNIVEIIEGNHRYALCMNPAVQQKTRQQRSALLEKTKQALEKLARSKRAVEDGKLGIRIGKVINQYKMSKFVDVTIKDQHFTWNFNTEKIANEEKLDGCYVISSDVSSEEMTIVEVVENYKKLMNVEQAFRNLKTTRLEIRPIYHRTDERIACHVFICMLAYYLMWHMKKMLSPILADDTNVGRMREYTFTHIMERLKSIRVEKADFDGIKYEMITDRDAEQAKILKLLGVKM